MAVRIQVPLIARIVWCGPTKVCRVRMTPQPLYSDKVILARACFQIALDLVDATRTS